MGDYNVSMFAMKWDISDIPDETYIEQENNQLIINPDKKRISEKRGFWYFLLLKTANIIFLLKTANIIFFI